MRHFQHRDKDPRGPHDGRIAAFWASAECYIRDLVEFYWALIGIADNQAPEYLWARGSGDVPDKQLRALLLDKAAARICAKAGQGLSEGIECHAQLPHCGKIGHHTKLAGFTT